MANTGQHFKAIEEYVNTTVQKFIEPHEDFMSISMKHKGSEGIAYLKLVDAADDAEYFDASSLDEHGLCVLISKIIAGDACEEKLMDYEQRKEVAKLFR